MRRDTETLEIRPENRAASSPMIARDLSWRRIMLQAAGMWLATRFTLVIFTAFAAAFTANLTHAGQTTFTLRSLALLWQRWDAQWYLGIAQHGYFSAQSAAFFPLYPLLIRAVTMVIGSHWLAAALLVANAGSLAAFVGLGLLAAHEGESNRAAPATIGVFAAYPLAFFLAAPYTEGVFLAFVIIGLLAIRRGWWPWATLCTALAMLTRPTGIILLPPLLYEYGRRQGWWAALRQRQRFRPGRLLARHAGGLALMLVGAIGALGLYMLFLAHQFGDPLLFLHAEQLYWHHTPVVSAVHQTLTHRTAPAAPTHPAPAPGWTYEVARSLVDLAPVAIFGILTLVAARRLPGMYTLYMACLLVLVVASPRPNRLGYFVSAGRYLIAAVPLFLLLARWAERHPWLDLLLTSGGFLLQAIFATAFLAGGWMV